ncbi:THO complex subunit 7 [Quaeritorhiza haematococci]|nr:THO complex subunit 7 [Quaeritorhiza haematococci]
MEDSIIRTRILVDVRPLKKCLRRFHQFTANLAANNINDAQAVLDQFFTDLAQFEAGMLKFQLVHDMNVREVKHYEDEQFQIEQEIQEAKADIENLKLELEEAQRQRRNKMEYDSMAKTINKYPTRQQSQINITQLNVDITRLEAEKRSHAAALELRRKQFLTVMEALHTMQDIISDAREQEEHALQEQFATGTPPPMQAPPQEEEEEGVFVEEDKDMMDV